MKTYKFKLYRSKKNRHLHQQINISGLIYNHCIALHRRYYRLFGASLNAYALMKHITKLKKLPKYDHWNMVGSQAIQDIVQRIDKAYKLFFGNLKRALQEISCRVVRFVFNLSAPSAMCHRYCVHFRNVC